MQNFLKKPTLTPRRELVLSTHKKNSMDLLAPWTPLRSGAGHDADTTSVPEWLEERLRQTEKYGPFSLYTLTMAKLAPLVEATRDMRLAGSARKDWEAGLWKAVAARAADDDHEATARVLAAIDDMGAWDEEGVPAAFIWSVAVVRAEAEPDRVALPCELARVLARRRGKGKFMLSTRLKVDY